MANNLFKRFHMVNDMTSDVTMELSTQQNAKQKLWDYIVKNMSNGNKIVLRQKDAADHIGTTRQYVSKILKELVKKDLIVKAGKDQTNVIFIVNPNKVWKGDGAYHQSVVNSFLKHKIEG